MGRTSQLARQARPGCRTSAAETRRQMFSEGIRKALRGQWRDAARKSSRVHLHLFNEAEGIEFYVTGWNGADTVAALTNEGFRNVSLHEVRGCKVDSTWDTKTPLWAVMEDHTYASDSTSATTRARYDPFDKMFSQYLSVSGTGDAPEKNRKLVGESRKFALQEDWTKPAWIVATNAKGEWRAAQRNRDIPMNFLPVETVRAMTEGEAIEQGRELHESGTRRFSTKAPVYNPFFRNASGMTLDMDRVMAEALEEQILAEDAWSSRILKTANRHKSRLGQWYPRVVKLAKAGDHDEAVDVLVGAFGMNRLPADVAKLLKSWETVNESVGDEQRRPFVEARRGYEGKEITQAIARSFWASTWADYQEEQGNSLRGEIMDQAPRTPRKALQLAVKFVRDLERSNKKKVGDLYQQAINTKGRHSRGTDPEDFGHALAMMSMGHGVSWFDDHPKFPLKVPYTLEHHGAYDFDERDLNR